MVYGLSREFNLSSSPGDVEDVLVIVIWRPVEISKQKSNESSKKEENEKEVAFLNQKISQIREKNPNSSSRIFMNAKDTIPGAELIEPVFVKKMFSIRNDSSN